MEQTRGAVQTYAGFWIRVWAAIIDTLLLALIIGPVIYGIYGPQYFESEAIIQGPADFLLTWVLPAIAVILFWIYKSATPGKLAIHARVVDARTGKPASTSQCIGRYLGYYLSALPVCLGFIWVAFDEKKQGFHDKLAGTVVVRTDLAGR